MTVAVTHQKIAARAALVILVAVALVVHPSSPARAARVDDLKAEIGERNAAIAELEQEIERYKKQLDETGKEKASLSAAIRTLELSRKRLLTDIRVTENKIAGATLTIEKLDIEIDDKEKSIVLNTDAVGATLRKLNEADRQTLVEVALANVSISEFFDEVQSLESFQASIREHLTELAELKRDLEDERTARDAERVKLSRFKTDLTGQREVVEATTREKSNLLTVTKNKEENYKTLLEEKQAKKVAFERELRDFEAELRLEIDPSSIPPSGAGILAWPLDKIVITQHFGQTSFSTQNPQVYNGNGHNGVDFAASIGTKVKSALSGVVLGVGDTDTVCKNASYGKWVLVKHANGLSTLYAHLSHIGVAAGQNVATGDTIGLSGNTGYSTGPHLHFTVYATQGVRVSALKSKVCGGTYTIPLADQRAYLNPLSYL